MPVVAGVARDAVASVSLGLSLGRRWCERFPYSLRGGGGGGRALLLGAFPVASHRLHSCGDQFLEALCGLDGELELYSQHVSYLLDVVILLASFVLAELELVDKLEASARELFPLDLISEPQLLADLVGGTVSRQ